MDNFLMKYKVVKFGIRGIKIVQLHRSENVGNECLF